MGAWIEIDKDQTIENLKNRRTPRWVRGLKSDNDLHNQIIAMVAPHDGCVDWNIIVRYIKFFA